MKIAVVSDTHGINKEIIESLSDMGKFDLLLHLGDHVDDGIKISKALGLKAVIVSGNCDHNSTKDYEELIEVDGKKIFLTHGHRYNVNFDLNTLYYKAQELGADIALFGHTHIPIILKENDITIMNPGSPSLPRTKDKKKTFGVVKINGDRLEVEIVEIK